MTFEYKCRRCGQIVERTVTSNQYGVEAELEMALTNAKNEGRFSPQPTWIYHSPCWIFVTQPSSRGKIGTGIADLVGGRE